MAAALVYASVGLAACGGGSQGSSRQGATGRATKARDARTEVALPPSNVSPDAVLAHVGSKEITFATVKHLMMLQAAPNPVPDPPSYTRCIAHLKAGAEAKAVSAPTGQSVAEVRHVCAQTYASLLQTGLSGAIHNVWLADEAADEGITVAPREVQREFDRDKGSSFHTEAEFEAYRKSTGESVADMMLELKLDKIVNDLFARVARKEHPATSAEVAAYYDAHRRKYAIPAGRDVRILRTTTRTSAERVMRELEAGKSFAAVAKELSAIGQPIGAKGGEVKDLEPHVYEEISLNDAIFSAHPRRLYGPLQLIAKHKTIAPETNSGFYVFEVVRTVPEGHTPLSQVKAAIAKQLTETQRKTTLSSFVEAFRRKWTARTSCEPGYMAKNCKQYPKSEFEITKDPYTF